MLAPGDQRAGFRGQMRRGSQRRFGAPPVPEVGPEPVFAPPPLHSPRPAADVPAPPSDLAAMKSMMGELAEAMLGAHRGTGAGQVPAGALHGSLGASIYDATLAEPGQSTPELSTNELRAILTDKSAWVFDSRTHREFSIGHLPGAINVAPKPGVAMSQYVSDVMEIERVTQDKQAPIVVYCNGPFCGKSRRLADDLIQAGFSRVSRYQLGTPTWRALVGMMVIEISGIRYLAGVDRTAVFIDARPRVEFTGGSLLGARNVSLGQLIEAKDDGRLPMDDFNTRLVVFGRDARQAEELAEALVQQGFNNVKYYQGTYRSLVQGLS